jgi:hypothetical protein
MWNGGPPSRSWKAYQFEGLKRDELTADLSDRPSSLPPLITAPQVLLSQATRGRPEGPQKRSEGSATKATYDKKPGKATAKRRWSGIDPEQKAAAVS